MHHTYYSIPVQNKILSIYLSIFRLPPHHIIIILIIHNVWGINYNYIVPYILYNSNGRLFICMFSLQVSLIRGGKLFPKRNVGHILMDLDSLNLVQQHTYTEWFRLSKTPRDTWFIAMSLFSSSCNHQNTLFLTFTKQHFTSVVKYYFHDKIKQANIILDKLKDHSPWYNKFFFLQ